MTQTRREFVRQPLITTLLALAAIIAFAGNSLLARAALADGAIEPGAYSVIRLASGALVLLPFIGVRPSRGDLPGATALLVYVAFFSLAYVNLDAGIGALILFGFVQATVITIGIAKGERLGAIAWVGLGLAIAGLFYVLVPWNACADVSSDLLPSLLMAIAGIAWGAYTLIGRGSSNMAGGATGSTARNFLIASILVLPMLVLDRDMPNVWGASLAIVSGTLTSGLGYVVWYKVAPRLGLATVSSVQLATPVMAALGGIVLLSEPLTWRLGIGGAVILTGILLTLVKSRQT